MPTYKGIHGTTKLRADYILKEGFKLSKSGRAGKGIYFWEYFHNPNYSKKFAEAWFRNSKDRKQYEDEANPECAVINAQFDVDDENFVDCTGEICENVCSLLEKLNEYDDDDINSAYNSIFEDLENLRGSPILLARANVTPPKKVDNKMHRVLNSPQALVVRSEEVKIIANLVE